MSDLISRQAAIDIAPKLIITLDGYEMHNQAVTNYCAEITQLPPAQPEQLEQCPIYGGMCAYPSDQCYDCPRHAERRWKNR